MKFVWVCSYAPDYVIFSSFLLNSLNLFIDIGFILFSLLMLLFFMLLLLLRMRMFIRYNLLNMFFSYLTRTDGVSFSINVQYTSFFSICLSARAHTRARYVDIDLANSLWMQNFLRKGFLGLDWIGLDPRLCSWFFFLFSSGVRQMALAKRIILLFCSIFCTLACFRLLVVIQ